MSFDGDNVMRWALELVGGAQAEGGVAGPRTPFSSLARGGRVPMHEGYLLGADHSYFVLRRRYSCGACSHCHPGVDVSEVRVEASSSVVVNALTRSSCSHSVLCLQIVYDCRTSLLVRRSFRHRSSSTPRPSTTQPRPFPGVLWPQVPVPSVFSPFHMLGCLPPTEIARMTATERRRTDVEESMVAFARECAPMMLSGCCFRLPRAGFANGDYARLSGSEPKKQRTGARDGRRGSCARGGAPYVRVS